MYKPNLSSATIFFTAIILMLCLPLPGNGQPFRIGKITPEDFVGEVYEKDPEASAVILSNYGLTSMELDSRTGGFQYVYRMQMRLQILDERGYDWANHSLSLYESGLSKETMTNFKGYVHNIEGNKVNTTRVKSRDGMTERTSENWKKITYTFPEIKPGSIIEYGYTIRSPFLYNLPTWQFQYGIPVEYSEYELRIPEFYKYQFFMQGYEVPSISEQKITSTTYTLRGDRPTDGVGHVSANITNYRWVMQDIPALRAEPYTNNIRNYMSIIYFELASIGFPGQHPERFVLNWTDVDKRLQDSEYFGGFLSGSRQMRQEMNALDAVAGNQEEKIMGALAYVHNNIRWNRSTGVYASGSPRQVLRKGEGNVADVNLMLVAALRQLGMNAEAVVSSTRSNGIVISAFPTLSRFNYVLATVKLENGKSLLLDATDPLCPPGMIPDRAINGQGRIIGENFASWVDLAPLFPSTEQKTYHLKLDADGRFSGSAEIQNMDYAAYNIRHDLENEKDLEKFRESMQAEVTGMEITNLEILNEKDFDQPLIQKFDFNLTDAVSHTGDMIFFNPLLFEGFKMNPLRLEERKYPVDFSYPVREELTFLIDIPQGFELDFVPAPAQEKFSNQANFSITSSLNEENQIQVQAVFEILNPLILPADYQGIKNFFGSMVEKHNEQISLKAI